MDEYGKTKKKEGFCPALYAPSAPILAPFLHGNSGSLSQFLMNFNFFHHIVRIFLFCTCLKRQVYLTESLSFHSFA